MEYTLSYRALNIIFCDNIQCAAKKYENYTSMCHNFQLFR